MTALLSPGARIAAIAPASRYPIDARDRGLEQLRAWGYTPVVPEGTLDPVRSLAASDEVRLRHLQQALDDPGIDAIWAIRGGYGVTRILDRINWSTARPKPVFGFSDLTPLLDQVARRLGAPAVHGPVLTSLASSDAATLSWLRDLLNGTPHSPLVGTSWVPGVAEGPVVGGNLCLLAATCGTAAQLDATGAIVVLEEIGEPAYRVDRMLQQCRSAGVFDGIAGVALGSFTDCHAPADQGWDINDVLRDHLLGLGVPVLADLPIGHAPANRAFVVRSHARIAADSLHLGAQVARRSPAA